MIPIGITDDDYNLLVDRMDEITDKTRHKFDERNTQFFKEVMNLLQVFCKDVKDVRVMVSVRYNLASGMSKSWLRSNTCFWACWP